MQGGLAQELESVIVQIGGLELTITARRVESQEPESNGGSSSSAAAVTAEVVSSPPGGTDPGFRDPFSITRAIEDEVIQADTPAALAAINLPFLAYLERRLKDCFEIGTVTWTAKARVARAFRAGCLAYRRLNGELASETSPGLPLRNSFYICVREPGNCLRGFWTASYSLYWNRLKAPINSNEFHPDSLSHAFPSRSEAEAYLLGARRQWPPALQ